MSLSQSNSLNELPQIRMTVLGRFRIERGAKEIQFPTRKMQSLLAYLVLNPESHAREKLAAVFWGESPDTEARNSLRNALATLTKKLGHAFFIVDRHNLQLAPDYPLRVDVFEFKDQAASFLDGPASDQSLVDLGLYQNDLLVDFYDDWIVPHREHYRILFLDLLLALAQHMRSQSEYEQAIGYARRALVHDPANERAHQHLMFCHMALGNRHAALRQFEDCVHALMEELAIQPSPATQALYEWIRQTPAQASPFEARITNLPLPLTSFIGRKAETVAVKRLLSVSRLLTLSGPGGSGKTRLAVQVGMDVLDSFQDGVWWVELAALTDSALVAQTVAKALGIQDAPGGDLVEGLSNHLRPRNLLLIIDNCEHLVEACARLIDLLLKECPHLKIIATSRESLNLAGEQVWQVPPMALPDPAQLPPVTNAVEFEGITLFVERARAVSPGFYLTAENAAAVAQTCLALDGIPLAIELAAARIKLLSPGQIADRLYDRFQLLTGGSRTALPRHQTLQAAMDWSYNLLIEAERLLLQRLAVFSGGWDLDAAEAVCSGKQLEKREILALLSNLVDKSLVINDGEQRGRVRYRILETIRQYAQDVLQHSGAAHLVQERHLGYFHTLAAAPNPHLGFFLPDSDMQAWLNVLAPEIDNLRAARRFCLANPQHALTGLAMAANLHWFWLVTNRLMEGRDWINGFLSLNHPVPETLQALARLSAGFMACWQGNFAAARADLEIALDLFTTIEDHSGIAFSLHGLGFAANGLGEHALAGQLFDRCLNTAREINDSWLVSFALHFLAIGTAFQGDLALARARFEEHIALTNEGMGNAQGLAFSLFHLGRIDRLQGDYPAAHTRLTQAIQLFWHMGDRRGLGYAFVGFACLAQALEEPQRAARLFGAVDTVREEQGSLLEVVLQMEYEHSRSTTRAAIGEAAFNASWMEGREMSYEQAFQYALAQDDS